MFSAMISVLTLCIIAGLVNGSYAIPIKLITKWKEENIWFVFSIFAFFIFPILTLIILEPHVFSILKHLPLEPILVAVIGGLIYGIGQVCMAFSFRMIGLGLAFVITISICTAGGALIPIFWNMEHLMSIYFLLQVIGVIIFTIAVIFSYRAGLARAKKKNAVIAGNITEKKSSKILLVLGVFLAGISGIGGAVEGASFAYANTVISKITPLHNISNLESQLISWCILFCAAGIPFALFFLIKIKMNSSFSLYLKKETYHYWVYILFMGFCYWVSIVFFCKATDSLEGDLAPTIAWPLFMIAIITASNFWGFIFGEWKGAGKKAKRLLFICLSLFVIAVIIFSMSSYFVTI
jgi:L-rhamnose-H+ transport protein